LLDEIAEMPVDLQPKLLRVLQEKAYQPVGSEKMREADFRLICSTNRDPFEAINEGMLREDLYYRINTIEIRIPPLRDRMDDVPVLAEYFLKQFGEKYERSNPRFSPVAYDQMLRYHWRGNVRELQNNIERALLLSKNGTIERLDLPTSDENSMLPTNSVASFAENNGLNLTHSLENLSELEIFRDHRQNDS
jgi:transcriptional regulator with PAS, ATPase and Fis domain